MRLRRGRRSHASRTRRIREVAADQKVLALRPPAGRWRASLTTRQSTGVCSTDESFSISVAQLIELRLIAHGLATGGLRRPKWAREPRRANRLRGPLSGAPLGIVGQGARLAAGACTAMPQSASRAVLRALVRAAAALPMSYASSSVERGVGHSRRGTGAAAAVTSPRARRRLRSVPSSHMQEPRSQLDRSGRHRGEPERRHRCRGRCHTASAGRRAAGSFAVATCSRSCSSSSGRVVVTGFHAVARRTTTRSAPHLQPAARGGPVDGSHGQRLAPLRWRRTTSRPSKLLNRAARPRCRSQSARSQIGTAETSTASHLGQAGLPAGTGIGGRRRPATRLPATRR